MATTTFTVAANTVVSESLTGLAVGPHVGDTGCTVRGFTATAGTGNYPIAGLTLDLSALFPHKVYSVTLSPVYDPAVASGDLAYLAVYVPGTDNDPATGKVYMYAATGIMIANDAVAITGLVMTGVAIGH